MNRFKYFRKFFTKTIKEKSITLKIGNNWCRFGKTQLLFFRIMLFFKTYFHLKKNKSQISSTNISTFFNLSNHKLNHKKSNYLSNNWCRFEYQNKFQK